MPATKKQQQKVAPLERADIALAEALVPIRHNPLVEFIGSVSEVGDQPPLYVISGAVIAVGLAMDDPRTMRAGARMLAAHAAATMVKGVVKRCVDRTRPDLLATKDTYQSGPGHHDSHDYNSFPSGHTASSVAVARAIGREYPHAKGAAVGVAGAIAVTQVVRSTHFVSDIVAGAALGLAAEWAVDQLFRRLHPDVD